MTDTPTQTETFTTSPTSTATPILGPGEVPGLKKATLAPVPVYLGTMLKLYAPRAVFRSEWRVFNMNGEQVAMIDARAGEGWVPRKVAPGIYMVDVEIEFKDGSKDHSLQKVTVLAP